MKKSLYGALAAASLLPLYQAAFADTLTVDNTTSHQIYLKSVAPAKGSAEVAPGGKVKLDSSVWAQAGDKHIYLTISADSKSSGDICQNSPFAKYNATMAPSQGDFVLSEADKGYDCELNDKPEPPPGPSGDRGQAAYRQINVDENYVDGGMADVIGVGGHFPAPTDGQSLQLSISAMPSALAQSLEVDKYGVLRVKPSGDGQPSITPDQFKQLSECSDYKNRLGQKDSNIKQCTVKIQNATDGSTVTVPLLINNGLRKLSAPELTNRHIGQQGQVSGPDLFEVAVTGSGSDLNLDLNQYTADPVTKNTGIQFVADAARVLGTSKDDMNPLTSNSGAKSVSDISGLGQVKHGSLADFGFAIKDGKLINTGKLQPGHLYQVNLAAVAGDQADSDGGHALEKAYITLYIYDDVSNVTFNEWQQGAVAKTSVLKTVDGNQPLTMVYSYTHSDPTKSMSDFINVYKGYANDIHYGNQKYRLPEPINVLAFESAGPVYQGNLSYWSVDSKKYSNVKDQITHSQVISNGQGGSRQWLPKLSRALNHARDKDHLNYSADLTFGNGVKADFYTYNFEQLEQLTGEMLDGYIYKNKEKDIDPSNMGISLDLEKGTGNNFAPLFSLISDKLAYQGRFFGYYEFADKAFQPAIVGAMGPMGVAFVSGYDVGGQGSQGIRASQQQYVDQGMTSDQAQSLYNNVFYSNPSCSFGSGDPVGRYSWCNLSMSDSNVANDRAWTTTDDSPNRYHISTRKVFDLFNGNFSLTQPFAESSTDFSYQELFNPNFTMEVSQSDRNVLVTGGGLVQTNPTECNGLDNAWLKENDSDLLSVITKYSDESDREKHSKAYSKLASCLFANVNLASENGAHQSMPVTKISICGMQPGSSKPVPLSHCMLLSGIPSGDDSNNGQLSYPTPAGYMMNNATPYLVGGHMSTHNVGYALFALQDTASAKDDGEFYNQPAGPTDYNIAIQEPWYVGGPALIVSDVKAPAPTTLLPYDPFYSSDIGKAMVRSAWSGVAALQKAHPNK